MRILVVEDEALVREVAVTILEDAGHLVVEAADGEQALELLRASTFDVLFTDIKLPGQDGWTVAEHFRAAFPDAPVIFATGYAPRYLAFARSILLNKPYRAAQVLQALEKLAA